MKKMTHAELNINVVTLKLYSLFYSLMMNDFDRVLFDYFIDCIHRAIYQGSHIERPIEGGRYHRQHLFDQRHDLDFTSLVSEEQGEDCEQELAGVGQLLSLH